MHPGVRTDQKGTKLPSRSNPFTHLTLRLRVKSVPSAFHFSYARADIRQ